MLKYKIGDKVRVGSPYPKRDPWYDRECVITDTDPTQSKGWCYRVMYSNNHTALFLEKELTLVEDKQDD